MFFIVYFIRDSTSMRVCPQRALNHRHHFCCEVLRETSFGVSVQGRVLISSSGPWRSDDGSYFHVDGVLAVTTGQPRCRTLWDIDGLLG